VKSAMIRLPCVNVVCSDCVHEMFGHMPLLCDSAFAELSQQIGLASLGASDEDIVKIARVCFTVVDFHTEVNMKVL